MAFDKKFLFAASFLVALLVLAPVVAALPSAFASGYEDDYESIEEKLSYYHFDEEEDCEEEEEEDCEDDDHDDIKEKLLKLIELDVSCADSTKCDEEDESEVLDLGTEVTVDISAKVKDLEIFEEYPLLAKFVINLLVNDLHVTVTGPSGVILQEDIDSWKDNEEFDADEDYGEKLRTITFTLDQPGEWTVDVEFTKFGHVIKTFDCAFFVIPESPVGAAALMGSSLAALGGFFFLRRRNSGGTTDLGT
jgi:hypothetical protein